jgi:hypothetical protein
MFAVDAMREPQSAPQVMAATMVADPVPAPVALEPGLDAAPAAAAPVQPISAASQVSTAPAATPANLRTVRVMPLQNQGTGASFAAVETFFNAFMDNLRAQKDLVVFAPDSTGSAADTAQFRFRVRGYGPVPGGKFGAEVSLEVRNPDGSYQLKMAAMPTGDIAADCASTPPFDTAETCRAPLHTAGAVSRILIAQLVPPDPRLQKDPLEQLLDHSMAIGARYEAFHKLRLQKRLDDPAVVRAVIDLAAALPMAQMRARIWEDMRNVQSPELLPPLVESLRGDLDAQVRQQAAATLGSAFAGDPRARVALEAAVQEDSSPLVRALARRGISGNEGWEEYIATSLNNDSRSDAERVDALVFAIQENPREDIRAFLQGGAGLESLGELMSRMKSTSTSGWSPLTMLMVRLASSADPATTDLLLANMGKLDTNSKLLSVLRSVPASRHADPRLRAELEKISVEEPDPNLRKFAVTMLESW